MNLAAPSLARPPSASAMSSHFAKPENALRKARDLVRVSKESSALKTLHNILISKRFRLWQPTHEQIMYLYIELAVDLRRNVKDALIQYRSICQQNIASLDKILRHYRQLAQQKTTEAEAKATAAGVKLSEEAAQPSASAVGGDDEEETSPETLLSLALSGEGRTERNERQVLLPWVRYQWESCRTILDVLRNNVRLERLYHEVARSSFQFCLQYQRKVEFRKLCDIMRAHLANVQKYQGQATSVDLSNPDTQLLYLETRFQQLEAAAALELWQEAYRTIEDIWENNRQPHVWADNNPLMKTYYDKLADIFWASSNFLFHAYSLDKFVTLSLLDEQMAAEKRQQLANTVVLASLIVSGSQSDEEAFAQRHEGAARLAQLLGFKKETPSRAKLLQLINAQGVLGEASAVVVQIYDLLENRFLPLSLSSALTPLLAQLEQDEALKKYVAPLQHLVIIRVLQQLSSVFKSIRIDKFLSLIPAQSVPGLTAIERLIMAAIQSDHLTVRIDHANRLLLFPDDDLESGRMKDQLVLLSRELGVLADRIEPVNVAQKLRERQHVFTFISNGVAGEHENVYRRQEEIEKRKQESERQAVEREKREAEQKATQAKARRDEEARRLEEESRKREAERVKKEAGERDLAVKQQLALEINRKVEGVAGKMSKGIAAKAAKKMKDLTADLEKIDKAALLAAQEAVLEQERREKERRRRETVRRVDYLTRAVRLEEREVLIANAEKKKQEDHEQLEADFARYVEEHKKAHERAMAERERLAKMSGEKDAFMQQLLSRRREILEQERAKQMQRFEVRRREHEREERRKREEEEAKEAVKEKRAAEERERLEKEAHKLRLADEERKRRDEDRAKREAERQELLERERRREEEYEKREREKRGEREPRPIRRQEADDRPAEDKWRRDRAADAERTGDRPVRAQREIGRRDDAPEREQERTGEEERQWRRDRAEAERQPEREQFAGRDRPERQERPERAEREQKEEGREWRRQRDDARAAEQQQSEQSADAAPLDEEAQARQSRFGGPRPSAGGDRDRLPVRREEGGRFGDRAERGDRDRAERTEAGRGDRPAAGAEGARFERGQDRPSGDRGERRFDRSDREQRPQGDERADRSDRGGGRDFQRAGGDRDSRFTREDGGRVERPAAAGAAADRWGGGRERTEERRDDKDRDPRAGRPSVGWADRRGEERGAERSEEAGAPGGPGGDRFQRDRPARRQQDDEPRKERDWGAMRNRDSGTQQ